MLAVIGAEFDLLIVVGVGGGDVHQVHFRVLQHLLIAPEGPLHAVFRGKGLSPGGLPGRHSVQPDGVVAGLIEFADGLRHDGRNAAGA